MILSYERYRIICCLRGIGSTSMRKALSIVFVIWIYSFGLTTPPLFGWGEYVLEGAHLR
jgi:c-opsin